MNRMSLTGIAAAIALGGILPACGCPYGEQPVNVPGTANAAPDSNAAAAPAAADTSAAATTAPTAAADTSAAATAAPAASATPANGTGAAPATPGAAAAAAPAAAAAAPAAGSGTISGQVTTTPAKAGKHIVVWLDGGGLPAKPKATEIDQKSMKFFPYLTAIPAGGKVVFRNSDPFPHNVFSPDGPDKFNLGMMPAKAARIHVFKNPGPSTLLCQIHPGMIAYVYTVPSKYYAIADSNGKYTIKNVPNGSYKLSAWAPKLAVSTTNVTVSGATATASLHLKRGN